MPPPPSAHSQDSFGDVLRGGTWLVGTVLSSPDLILAERIGQSFDFVWIDLEHSALTVRDAQQLAIAVKAGGAASLIRLPRPDSEAIGPILDAGVDGIVAPRVESESEARALVDAIRYPPAGSRGFAPRRASVAESSSPGDVVCVVQIESANALTRLEAIAAVDGVDALVVGTSDLSFDLGAPLDVESDQVASAVRRTAAVASRSGKAWGVAVAQLPRWTTSLRRDGANMLVFASDTKIYADAIRSTRLRVQALDDVSSALPYGRRDRPADVKAG